LVLRFLGQLDDQLADLERRWSAANFCGLNDALPQASAEAGEQIHSSSRTGRLCYEGEFDLSKRQTALVRCHENSAIDGDLLIAAP
jgi:hypothetical protein